MASTNPRSASRLLRTPATLRISNPTDGNEVDSSTLEGDESYDSCSEYDTDDLSMKERIWWRAGAISPYVLESYPKPQAPSPSPPRYSPFAQLALDRGNVSCHDQEAEELDINYLGILSPPPRVFHNPHPSYHHDYDLPDRFSVRDFLEAPGHEDADNVEGSAHYTPLDFSDFTVGMVRPPTRALQSTKPLRIRRQKRPDPPTMYWDPTSQSLRRSFSSYSIYSQDSAPPTHARSQYCSSPHPQPMRPGVSTTGSRKYAFAPNSFLPSHIYCGEHEPSEYPFSMKNALSAVQADAPSRGSSQCHRPRHRGPLGLDKHGLPLIDEQKESTFTPADSQYLQHGLSNSGWHHAHHVPLGSQVSRRQNQSAVPLHPWLDEKREHPPQTTVSRQPGNHPLMSPKRRIGNRNAKRMPYSSDGKRDWSSDLCMFCDHNLGTCEFSVPRNLSAEDQHHFFFRLRGSLVPMYHLCEEQEPHRAPIRGGKGAS